MKFEGEDADDRLIARRDLHRCDDVLLATRNGKSIRFQSVKYASSPAAAQSGCAASGCSAKIK